MDTKTLSLHRFLQARILVPLFFIVLLLAGLLAFRGYGIAWDEKTMYVIGWETHRTVFEGAPVSENSGRRFHGPLFEFIMYETTKLLPLTHAQQAFFVRHLMGFLLFFSGVLAFFALARRHFNSWRWGLLAAAMLVLSPRIFAHSFFNTRDIPTLVFFIFSIWTLVRLLDRPTVLRVTLHAIACAVLMSTRMTGILLPMLTVFFLLLKYPEQKLKGIFKHMLIFALLWCLLTIAFWPLLWTDPIGNFLAAYQNMSNKGGGGFYMGEYMNDTPWHWLPVWLVITTPLLYTALFIVGIGRYVALFLGDLKKRSLEHGRELLFFFWFALPAGAILLGIGLIFDTWRHLFFIYPAFLLIALEGARWCFRKKFSLLRAGCAVLITFSLLRTGAWMVRAHPMQYVYFSLPPSYIQGKFALDYWGLGFQQGLQYIQEHDDDPVINVFVTHSAGYTNVNALTPEQRRRIKFSDVEQAKYFLDNFAYTKYKPFYPKETETFAIDVEGLQTFVIYRNSEWREEYQVQESNYPIHDFFFVFGNGFIDPNLPDSSGLLDNGNTMWMTFKV